MAIFGRRKAESAQETDPNHESTESDAAGDSDAAKAPTTPGPWDVTEAPQVAGRVDLGALRIPGVRGMALRMEVDRKSKRVIAANVTLGQSNIQLQAFAAPRTAGIWEEIREQISTSVTAQGGSVQEGKGPFGPELLALLPVKDQSGNLAKRPARFIGVDGPRWFLRAVVTGAALTNKDAARQVETYFSHIVVVRGTEARPPSELLTLTVPGQGEAQPEKAPAAPDLLTRGPEITEVR